MSDRPRPLLHRLRSRRVVVRSLFALLSLVVVGPQAWAWYHLRAAHAAAAAYHPDRARTAFDRTLAIWPWRASVWLAACRAARQADDLDAADAKLRTAQRLAGETNDDIAFEWALWQATAGNVTEVEEYLHARAGQSPAHAALAWEALATGYNRVYRSIDAMAVANQWLKLDPNNVRALELRGQTYVIGKGVKRGTEDYRRALDLDPTRDKTRWNLVAGLLDLGTYDEALDHLNKLATTRPDDPDVLVPAARCHNMLGRPAVARQTLDAVLAKHPDHGLALRTRGQFALADQQPADAEKYLRRAAVERPADYQTQWLLFQSLQQQPARDAEAKAQLKVAEDVKDRSERLGELRSRKLTEFPLDPGLHVEMAQLLIRGGQPALGERWLASALNLDADFAPAHAALADLYQQQGQTQKAADHRQRAGK